ncbi:hypothetical protein SEPCBS119000_001986 [Sporothrix epigloea]|uniref:Rrn7/TAF1B C-terminal cyclin domain-containing protein n=1 Tax=Sporothrix epigloea TaxID=1892477 RepID=A0ABP0DDX2_9PEZI
MLERLPAGYLRALTETQPFSVGGELHEAIMNLVKGFRLNHDLQFPGLNVPPILWAWTRDLGLPSMTLYPPLHFNVALKLMHRTKLLWIDYPDVLLLASIVMVTKLLLPFDAGDESKGDDAKIMDGQNTKTRHATSPSSQAICMDWDKWRAVYNELHAAQTASRRLTRQEMANLRPQDVWSLTADQIDDYMDWQQQFRLSDKEGVLKLIRKAVKEMN